MVKERPDGPLLLLLQDNDGWADPKLLRAEDFIGACRDEQYRANSPDEWFALVRREEKTLNRIAQAKLSAGADDIVLSHHGHDGPRYQIPILVQGEWNDRLKVHRVPEAVLTRA